MKAIFIDMIGKTCPIPVIETKKIIKELNGEEAAIKIKVDNDIARQNIIKMTDKFKYPSFFEKLDDGNILVTVEVLKNSSAEKLNAKSENDNFVVLIGANTMGRGDDELGAVLMKAYIFSLTELDNLPKEVLFINSGVFLTCEGSAALDDIQNLVNKNVTIKSCGACLNFYNMTEKLKIGEITNMYDISSAMANTGKVINV